MSRSKSQYKSYGNYDLEPFTELRESSLENGQIFCSWEHIWAQFSNSPVILIDCYQGVLEQDIVNSLGNCAGTAQLFSTDLFFRPESEIRQLVFPDVTDDAIFGCQSRLQLQQYIDLAKLEALRKRIVEESTAENSLQIVVYGPGAALLAPDLQVKKQLQASIVYCDMARWEIQQRQRQGLLCNLGVDNLGASAKEQYKHSYFVDWRVLDRHKQATWHLWDWVIDCNQRQVLSTEQQPKMLASEVFFKALQQMAHQPFRLVPFFDPGIWGGQWMKEVCGLQNYRRNTAAAQEPPNYAWCFDCVPEENSLQIKVGGQILEFPAVDLIFAQARAVLGDPVHARFGKEFPIRFDFLDTMGGQNLSFQVHPTTEYIQQHFGMHYTQDESYYILDAEEEAVVYLGLRDGVVPKDMLSDLERAQQDAGCPFPAEKYVHTITARKHDHFLIPAGTTHCSGAGSMVLEISATPYIFTFKLWDWGRMDLDGTPRPINLAHGAQNIDWGRTSHWVDAELSNHCQLLSAEESCHASRAERTGLHKREFIETRRYWFSGPTWHQTGGLEQGSVHVLNLVEGEAAWVKSPSEAFAPFQVHYAETFVIPAAVGEYIIEPSETGQQLAVVKAYVRLAAGTC